MMAMPAMNSALSGIISSRVRAQDASVLRSGSNSHFTHKTMNFRKVKLFMIDIVRKSIAMSLNLKMHQTATASQSNKIKSIQVCHGFGFRNAGLAERLD